MRILYLLVNCTDGTKKEELNKVVISNDGPVVFVVFFLMCEFWITVLRDFFHIYTSANTVGSSFLCIGYRFEGFKNIDQELSLALDASCGFYILL